MTFLGIEWVAPLLIDNRTFYMNNQAVEPLMAKRLDISQHLF